MSKSASKKRAQDDRAHTLNLRKRLKSSHVSWDSDQSAHVRSIAWHQMCADMLWKFLQEILAEVRKLSNAQNRTTKQRIR